MTSTGGLPLSVFIASSMSGWSGCFYLSVWQTSVCCIYSGLTQGQGHTVRHPLLFEFFEPNFGLVYLQLIPRGLSFRIQYTMKKLTKNTVTSLYCETIGYGVPFDSTLIPVKVLCTLYTMRLLVSLLHLQRVALMVMRKSWSVSSIAGGRLATLSLLGGCAGLGRK